MDGHVYVCNSPSGWLVVVVMPFALKSLLMMIGSGGVGLAAAGSMTRRHAAARDGAAQFLGTELRVREMR